MSDGAEGRVGSGLHDDVEVGGEVRDEGVDGVLLEAGSGNEVMDVIGFELREETQGGLECIELVKGGDGISGSSEVGGGEVEVGDMFVELVQGREFGAELEGEAVKVLVCVGSEGDCHGVHDGAGGEELCVDEGVRNGPGVLGADAGDHGLEEGGLVGEEGAVRELCCFVYFTGSGGGSVLEDRGNVKIGSGTEVVGDGLTILAHNDVVGQDVPDGVGGDEEQEAVDVKLRKEAAGITVYGVEPGPEVFSRLGGEGGRDRTRDGQGGDIVSDGSDGGHRRLGDKFCNC